MSKQDQRVFEKFEFLGSLLDRYKESSYNQLRPLIENPQTLFETFEEKPIRLFLHAQQQNEDKIFVLLSELIELDGEDICSWYNAGFKKLKSGENIEITYNENAHCPFCEEASKFNLEMPIESFEIYHCFKCKNFFEPTSTFMIVLGTSLSSIFSLISLFLVCVGGFMLVDILVDGHFYSRFTFVAMILTVSALAILYFSVKKTWQGLTDPILTRVSDFRMYFEDEDNF